MVCLSSYIDPKFANRGVDSLRESVDRLKPSALWTLYTINAANCNLAFMHLNSNKWKLTLSEKGNM